MTSHFRKDFGRMDGTNERTFGSPEVVVIVLVCRVTSRSAVILKKETAVATTRRRPREARKSALLEDACFHGPICDGFQGVKSMETHIRRLPGGENSANSEVLPSTGVSPPGKTANVSHRVILPNATGCGC